MVTQQVLLVAAAMTVLTGGGTYAGYHLMDDDATCSDMEAMHGMNHDAMHNDMEGTHEECHTRMDDHDHSTTADSERTHGT